MVINTEGDDGELNISLSELLKSPQSTLEEDHFKEQLISNVSKDKEKKTETSQTDDLSITKLPLKTTLENNILDSDDLPTNSQPSTSANDVIRPYLEERPSSHNNMKSEMMNEDNLESDSEPTSSTANVPVSNRKRVNLYAPDTGPQMYQARGNLVTRPIITKNLPKVFQYLPIYGKPAPNTSLDEFYTNKVRDFVGFDLNDEEFEDLENYCR